MKIDQVRSFALSLPGASVQAHFEKSSFRVNNKIFVTVLPDNAHIHGMLDRRDVERAVAEAGTAFEELWWGKRLTGLLDLARDHIRGPLTAGGIKHGADVVHALFQCRQRLHRNRIGEPCATLVDIP